MKHYMVQTNGLLEIAGMEARRRRCRNRVRILQTSCGRGEGPNMIEQVVQVLASGAVSNLWQRPMRPTGSSQSKPAPTIEVMVI